MKAKHLDHIILEWLQRRTGTPFHCVIAWGGHTETHRISDLVRTPGLVPGEGDPKFDDGENIITSSTRMTKTISEIAGTSTIFVTSRCLQCYYESDNCIGSTNIAGGNHMYELEIATPTTDKILEDGEHCNKPLKHCTARTTPLQLHLQTSCKLERENKNEERPTKRPCIANEWGEELKLFLQMENKRVRTISSTSPMQDLQGPTPLPAAG